MYAIGNDELKEEVRIGDIVINTKTKERIMITVDSYSRDAETGEVNILLIFNTDEECISYIIGVNGRLINPWIKEKI